MRMRNKILLTILLAVLCSWLFGREREHYVPIPSPETANGETDVAYLQQLYAVYNEAYFHNRLTKTPRIDLSETSNNMATTFCKNENDTDCEIEFNEKYVAAPRVADFTMLHEQCHVKTWMKDTDDFGIQIDHGKMWRSCMLELDAEGAFRQIFIDNYREDM